jgi:hypothetical protein
MPPNEKGRHDGDPIPNNVCQDTPESKSTLIKTQVFCAVRAINKRESLRAELIERHGRTVVRIGRLKPCAMAGAYLCRRLSINPVVADLVASLAGLGPDRRAA